MEYSQVFFIVVIFDSNENDRSIRAAFEVLKAFLQLIKEIFIRFDMNTKMGQSKMTYVKCANKESLDSRPRDDDDDIGDTASNDKTLERRHSLSIKVVQMHEEEAINAMDNNVENKNIININNTITKCTNAPFDPHETPGACVGQHAIAHVSNSNSKSIRLAQINDGKDSADITPPVRHAIVASHGSVSIGDDNNQGNSTDIESVYKLYTTFALQFQAKVSFVVDFLEHKDDVNVATIVKHGINSNNNSNNNTNNRNDKFHDQVMASASIPPTAPVQAIPLPIERRKCIFRTLDDCRQDTLALQVMAL